MAYNPTVGTRTSLSITGLSTLASGTYVQSSDYNCNTNKPADVIVEIEVGTTGAPAGNKQIVVFIQESVDGVNYRSGPTSGSTTTDEANLRFLGTVPMNSTATIQRGFFSVASSLGFVPRNFKIVIKNDLGVSLTSGVAYTAEVTF